MPGETYEFEITVRVRKRLHISGPADREAARAALRQALSSGMAPSIFAKRALDGAQVETIIMDSPIIVEDARAEP